MNEKCIMLLSKRNRPSFSGKGMQGNWKDDNKINYENALTVMPFNCHCHKITEAIK